MIPCRNGEGRKSWTCDSGRYLDSCETSRSAWVTFETEGEALQTARRMSSSRMLYSSLAPIATAQAFLEDGNCTIGVRDVAAWSLRGPSITSARGAWRWYGFNNRLMSSSPSYSGDFTASAASLSKAERRTLVEKLVHCNRQRCNLSIQVIRGSYTSIAGMREAPRQQSNGSAQHRLSRKPSVLARDM